LIVCLRGKEKDKMDLESLRRLMSSDEIYPLLITNTKSLKEENILE
jgi:hypothetical protein